MIPEQIKQMVYKRYLHPLVTRTDFVMLSKDIFKSAAPPFGGEDRDSIKLDPDVLQEMFSDKKPPVYPGASAMNTLAQYLGYGSWYQLPGSEDTYYEITRKYQKEMELWEKHYPSPGVFVFLPLIIVAIGVAIIIFYKC